MVDVSEDIEGLVSQLKEGLSVLSEKLKDASNDNLNFYFELLDLDDSDMSSGSDATSGDDDEDHHKKRMKHLKKSHKRLKKKKKAIKALLSELKEVVQDHGGDSDASSDSDGVEDSGGELEETVKALKTLKKKYKKLKSKKKEWKGKAAEFQEKIKTKNAKISSGENKFMIKTNNYVQAAGEKKPHFKSFLDSNMLQNIGVIEWESDINNLTANLDQNTFSQPLRTDFPDDNRRVERESNQPNDRSKPQLGSDKSGIYQNYNISGEDTKERDKRLNF